VGLGRRILENYLSTPPGDAARTCPFVVVVGRSVDVHEHHAALFHWLANSDASRDAVWSRAHGCDRVGFDATPKSAGDAAFSGQPVRAWPPVLAMEPEVIARVEQRWPEYAIDSR
jgi:3-polyprenyl-4-hydroxybenzoate decarboxylase